MSDTARHGHNSHEVFSNPQPSAFDPVMRAALVMIGGALIAAALAIWMGAGRGVADLPALGLIRLGVSCFLGLSGLTCFGAARVIGRTR
ncbi:hypothetical protein ATO8_01160 [Roseivivax marinus]|uniref:Uncharacterized protein n=1 Tax=Roseivivax marinus TaxID=1379903 RepID=W4HR53_9RHOB|nr:hypothetical protein [Roseivivax marinus]ETW14475.1 hypothetical protein ATO8_01160 [Roseivivax marinus]SEL34809.1 hypothetical protein SAMN05444413_10847 [Roseivivax marinus]